MTRKFYEFDEIFVVLSADCKQSAMNRFHKRCGVQADPNRCREVSKSEIESKYPWVKRWTKEDHETHYVIGQAEWGKEARAMIAAQKGGK